MPDPRDFFETIVKPAIRSWEAERTAIHLAVHALAQIDILAEEIFRHFEVSGSPLARKVGDYRKDLRMRENDLGLAWDAHDTHKHGRLGSHRSVRLISNGQRPKMVSRALSYLSRSFFLGKSFMGRAEVMCLVLDDGSSIPLAGVLKRSVEAWERELARLGL